VQLYGAYYRQEEWGQRGRNVGWEGGKGGKKKMGEKRSVRKPR